MSRRLTPSEEALWRQVTASVRPLVPAASPPAAPLPAPVAAPHDGPDRHGVGALKAAPPRARPATGGSPRWPETLDARWDRRLASGKARPDRVIDLHGLSRAAARARLEGAVHHSVARGERLLLVITGKGGKPGPDAIDLMQGAPVRGAIRADLPRWLAEPGLAPLIAAVRRAHGRQGGDGALWLVLRRRALLGAAG